MEDLVSLLSPNNNSLFAFGTSSNNNILFNNVQSSSPRLMILHQDSLSTEKVSINGIQKSVLVVVKNHPFLIKVGSNGRFELTKTPIEVRLLYDTDSLKEVDFVKLKPLEYKCLVNEREDCVTMELKIKVLTSQLEDMFFRIRLTPIDPNTKKPLDSLSIITEPIKVVSKPEVLKRKKQKTTPSATSKLVNDLSTDLKDFSEDRLLNALHKIETTFDQQFSALTKLCNTPTSPSEVLNIEILNPKTRKSQKRFLEDEKKINSKEESSLTEFENTFLKFLNSYTKVSQEERPEKIRRLMRTTTTKDTDGLSEMLTLFQSESVNNCNEDPTNSSSSSCQCQDCPYRKELDRFDDFYNEFLDAPAFLGGL